MLSRVLEIIVGFAVQREALLLLVPMLPLIGAIFLLFTLGADKERRGRSGILATCFAFASFCSCCVFFEVLRGGVEAIQFQAWTWFSVDPLRVQFSFRFDHLAGVMSLVITGVGSLIHLYAIGYMKDDPDRPRFFCYLNLFLFAMLVLILADNLLLMFVGWEGVGLCSYLLIGFWHKEMPNAKAGQKAFVVNRIGDAGFLLGMFVLFWGTGTLNFLGLEAALPQLPPYLIETAAILLFVGAIGKSAQIPLYIWLPDAMAGPTPVSALIHAATMVTAGIYMVCRLAVLYSAAPMTLLFILGIGTLTAFFAATIALVQNDIKKVLAYSTVSQLGYMFMALGVGAYSSGIYHLVTHAFFKALLFMAAGSVIIGCHHEQDMRRFGGLWVEMWGTFLAYLVGAYAIIGLPPGAGFFSKDSVLWAVHSTTGLAGQLNLPVYGGIPLSHVFWGIGVFTAFLTSFYMTRSLVLTFFGKYRGTHRPHESSWIILVPLAPLMALSMFFGIGLGEEGVGLGDRMLVFLESWTRPDLLVVHEELAKNELYLSLEHLVTFVVLAGTLLAFCCYTFGRGMVKRLALAPFFSSIYQALHNKWWIDELYDFVLLRPLYGFSRTLFRVVDNLLIDGLVNGAAVFAAANGELLRRAHTGRIGTYVMVMFFGALGGVVFWMLL